jgi:ribosomal protein L11 methyltransferase
MRRVTLRVRPGAVEDVLDALLPRLPDGAHVRGDTLVLHARTAPLPDDLAVDGVVDITESDVPDDWRERRRLDGLGGVEVAGRIWLRSPDDPPPAPGLMDIVIERSAAFGTGAHPTTRMCLGFILGLEPRGAFSDLGCGAGALSIAAAKLGFAPVQAVDYDEHSVESARANARDNGVAVDANVLDLTRQAPPPARVFAANMPARVHRALQVPDVTEVIIVSGIRSPDDVTYEGWRRTDVLERDGWVAMLLERA